MNHQPLTVCPAMPSPRHLLAEGARRLAALGMVPIGAIWIPAEQWHAAGDAPANAGEALYIIQHSAHDYSMISAWFRCSWGPDCDGQARTAITVHSIDVHPDLSLWGMMAGEAYDIVGERGHMWHVWRCPAPLPVNAPGSWHASTAAAVQADIQDASEGGVQ